MKGEQLRRLTKLCETLFAGNCECYIEEENDQYRVLIFEPPPLDEVWLFEPEKQEIVWTHSRDRGASLK
jgi:hypothetical protein